MAHCQYSLSKCTNIYSQASTTGQQGVILSRSGAQGTLYSRKYDTEFLFFVFVLFFWTWPLCSTYQSENFYTVFFFAMPYGAVYLHPNQQLKDKLTQGEPSVGES